MGVPTSRPNWVSLSPRSFLICTPMMEKIVQTAKQTVKAIVESHSARLWSPRRTPATSFMHRSPSRNAAGFGGDGKYSISHAQAH